MDLTPKQEAFCLAYVETGNASEAYRRSYNAKTMKDTTINREAKALLDNPKITTRLRDIQQASRERHEITVERLTEMLIEDRAMARKNDQSAPAIAAVMGLAKLHGLIVDKQQLAGKDGGPVHHVIEQVIVDSPKGRGS